MSSRDADCRLGRILVATILAQLNDQVLTSALPDVSGGLGLGHDSASRLGTVYINGEVLGMIVAPSRRNLALSQKDRARPQPLRQQRRHHA